MIWLSIVRILEDVGKILGEWQIITLEGQDGVVVLTTKYTANEGTCAFHCSHWAQALLTLTADKMYVRLMLCVYSLVTGEFRRVLGRYGRFS